MTAVNLISEHLDLMVDYSREKSVMDYTEETSFQPKHSWTTRAQVLQDRSQNKTDRPFLTMRKQHALNAWFGAIKSCFPAKKKKTSPKAEHSAAIWLIRWSKLVFMGGFCLNCWLLYIRMVGKGEKRAGERHRHLQRKRISEEE